MRVLTQRHACAHVRTLTLLFSLPPLPSPLAQARWRARTLSPCAHPLPLALARSFPVLHPLAGAQGARARDTGQLPTVRCRARQRFTRRLSFCPGLVPRVSQDVPLVCASCCPFLLSACLLACIHAYMHAYVHACMHACIHTYIHTCMHACMHACIHACMHTYMHTYIHTYIHACMHACMHTYIHACIHTHVHTLVFQVALLPANPRSPTRKLATLS